MLKICSVTLWSGPSVGNRSRVDGTSTDWLLLTEKMENIQADGTGSKLYYIDNPYKRRAGNYMEITNTVASIVTSSDLTYENTLVPLPCFPTLTAVTAGTTTDRYVNVKDISRATAYTDADYSYLWYTEGMKTVKVLVNYTLQQLVDLCDSGTTSTS